MAGISCIIRGVHVGFDCAAAAAVDGGETTSVVCLYINSVVVVEKSCIGAVVLKCAWCL